MADLRTDYKDDVLNINTNERRKYRMINNADGTISFEDVTDYVQNGDSFGSNDVNAITERVNRSLTGADVVDNTESTATDAPFSANMGRKVSERMHKTFATLDKNELLNTGTKTLINSITIPESGLYNIKGVVAFAPNAGGYRLTELQINHTIFWQEIRNPVTNTHNTNFPLSLSGWYDKDDVIDIYVEQTSGASIACQCVLHGI